MKKIISLVVAAMMLMSLFAVNVGAVVTHGSVDMPWRSANFDDGTTAGVTVAGTSSVEDGKLVITNDTGVIDVPVDADNHTYPVANEYVVSFDVKAVKPTRGLYVAFVAEKRAGWFAGSSVAGVRLNGACFEEGADYNFVITFKKGATDITKAATVMYSKNGGDYVASSHQTVGTDYNNQIFQGSNLGAPFSTAKFEHRVASSNYTGTAGYAISISKGTRTDENIDYTDCEFHLDNLTVTYTKDLQSTGVILSQDYESSSSAFYEIKAEANTGIVTLATEDNGNRYLNLKSVSYAGGQLGGVRSGANGSVNTDEDFVIQFDMRQNVKGARFGVEVYTGTDRKGYSIRDFDNWEGTAGVAAGGGLERDTWYTFKIAMINGKAYVRRAVRGTNVWTVPHFVFDDYSENAKLLTGNIDNAVLISTCVGHHGAMNYNNSSTVADIDLDNIYVTNLEQTYFGEITADESMVYIPEFEFEDGAAYGDANLTAVLAAFDGDGKLVDAAFQTANAAAGYAKFTDLGMRSSGDKVYLYVWDTLANAKPVMDTPYLVYSAQ